MREQILKNYFDELIPSRELEAAVGLEIGDTEEAFPVLAIVTMGKSCKIRREQLIRLVDAGIAGLLRPVTLRTLFRMLYASKRFYWRDPLVGELLTRVGGPEPNLEVVRGNLVQMRRWLTGAEVYPEALPRLFTRWLGPRRWVPTLTSQD